MERKFKHYIIKTTTEDDSFKMTDNIINYKDALEEYRKIKTENDKSNSHIEAFGVLYNGEYQLLFDKYTCIVEDKSTIDKQTVYDIMDEINNLVNKIEKRSEYVNGLSGVFDKKRDVVYHEIENGEEITEAEKIAVYDNLRDISTKRREIKDEDASLQTLTNLNFTKHFKEIYKSFNKTRIKVESKKNKKEEIQNTMVVKEIPYKSHSERISIFSQMQKKYDKVTYDEGRKMIVCYNKIYGT